jgi:thiol-disulfide isomerase/thioredoxin
MKVSLYYADWCGHCQTFKPTWEILKKDLEHNGIEHEEFESENKQVMKDNNIGGYPTIKITHNNNVEDYNGPRGREEILIHLKNLQNTQTGGNNNELYYKKYLKYKSKYLQLKKNDSL